MEVKFYTVVVGGRFFKFWGRKYKCYRHELNNQTNHLILYRVDNTVISIPVAKRSWVVYADYWQFMKRLEGPPVEA